MIGVHLASQIVKLDLRKVVAAAVVLMLLPGSAMYVARAESLENAEIRRVEVLSPTRAVVSVFSPGMAREVAVDVLHPPGNAPRPSYYLLDGVDSGVVETNWTQKTDIVSFFADKQVNVVLPIGGRGSFYSDWERPDPVLGGPLKWETFLTQELPPLIDEQFHGTGRNVIGGLSMGAVSAVTLTMRYPELYRGVAAFSGCLDTFSGNARLAIRNSVSWMGGNPDNMWGPDGDPAWSAHDPITHAEMLAGKVVYISTGNGIPGPEGWSDPLIAQAVTFGAVLEYLVHGCTEEFQHRLEQAGVAATFAFHASGTHSWPYWQQDLHQSWPLLASAL